MWKWLENLFYNKALITTELVEKDEALKQCYDAWMDDRSQLNGARLELKVARKQITELEDLVRSQDKHYNDTIHKLKNREYSLETTKEEMQERIDELENEVHNLTVRYQNLVNQI
ncbi:hypothetical protein I906_gp54 [Bacillus phage Curly]|uniref:Uncharacterized protein n=1 Tax=Bacillus phage Curly TaxID=2880541 RepID=M1IE77_9CAUD|nr:hypothetical protein I906_gp54 [Bacillus phage Curly]AGE60741.1 hypothetical protein CURLY_54 [Bacillus phage Curly]